MTDDAASPLARYVCRTGYADLPANAVEAARRDILDTFGCMLGGSGSPGIDELFTVLSHWGGSRVLLRRTRLPALRAALLNASMGHALEFDARIVWEMPRFLALADRIIGVARDGRPQGSLSIMVQRTDRRSVTVEASNPIGSPANPPTNAHLETKLRDCGRNAVQPLPDASLDGLLAAIGRLETLPDARELMTAFAGE